MAMFGLDMHNFSLVCVYEAYGWGLDLFLGHLEQKKMEVENDPHWPPLWSRIFHFFWTLPLGIAKTWFPSIWERAWVNDFKCGQK